MSAVDCFVGKAEEFRKLLETDEKPRVVILGSFNSGKSTLVNSLLGADLSPVGIVPTTIGLISFSYGEVFRAKVHGTAKKIFFTERSSYLHYLSGMKGPGCSIEVEANSPILKKCTIVDTPGIDSGTAGTLTLAEKAVLSADKIIYLFHQRGIEDLNRVFLQKLAAFWKKKNLKDLSFWLNCNLGRCDGTSLEATRHSLRQIFLSPVRLNTIHTADPASLDALRLFLEVELARDLFKTTGNFLKKVDGTIPDKVKKVSGIKDDLRFLWEFWKIQETARLILAAGQALAGLPPVIGELEAKLAAINTRNIAGTAPNPGGAAPRPRRAGLVEVREALRSLAERLINDEKIAELFNRKSLTDIAAQIENERFTVVATGGFSTGKSTFFNALMKEAILPAGDGPTTSTVTRISYSPFRCATIHFALQVTLQMYEIEDGKAALCVDEVKALESWLHKGEEIACLEVFYDGNFSRTGRPELFKELLRLKKTFAAGASSRTAGGQCAAPLIFRLIPARFLSNAGIIRKVRITFKNAESKHLNLAVPEKYREFRRLTGPENAFRLESVEITHPAEYLKLATFIDTPGLDSVQKYHRPLTLKWVRESDACLVFLNAKHILAGMNSGNLMEPMRARLEEQLAAGDQRAYQKVFFVINFSDSLSPAQRETVQNFLYKNLSSPGDKTPWSLHRTQVFMVSALSWLEGKNGGMKSFLDHLEESVMRYRGRDFYGAKVDELYRLLDGAAAALIDTSPKSLLSAREALRFYKRELKNIRNLIRTIGRF
ncbi:MAG: dynamin family protein [Firmicutes bacterium]|nr:dynamin family protein [Bacillota bacterium]